MKTFANIQKEIISHLKSSARSAQGLLYSIGLVVTLLLVGTGNVWGETPGSGYTLVTSTASLANGDKVIIFCQDDGNGVTGWNNNKDATVSTTKSNWREFVVGNKNASGWTLQDVSAGKYIASPGGNEFKYANSGGTCSVNSSGVLVCNSRYLCKNGSNYRFYTSIGSYKAFYVYKVSSSTYTFHLMLPHGDGSFTQYNTTNKAALASHDTVMKYKDCYGSATFWTGSWTNYWTPAANKVDFADRTTSTGTRYNSSTTFPINSETEITLYPQFAYGSGTSYYHNDPWCPTYHVYYDGNGNTGGSDPEDDTDYDGGDNVTVLEKGTLVKTGYTFLGWSTSSSAIYADGDYDPGDEFTIDGNVFLYAVWCKDTPDKPTITTVTPTGVGASITWTAVSDAVSYNVMITNEAKDVNVTGTQVVYPPSTSYTFASGLEPGTNYYAAVQVVNNCDNKRIDTEAFTTPNAYVIQYNNNGGSGSIANGAKTEGVNFTLSNGSGMNKDGYHMTGWLLNSTSGTHYNLSGTYSTDADATFYAEWTANTYSVVFNRNGGTGGANMSNQNFTYDVAQNLTSCTYTKTDYNFAGWATSQANADAGTVAYTDGQSVNNLTTTNSGTVNLYAVWTAKTYTNYRTLCDVAKILDYITIDTDPTKLNYLVGETVNTAGAVVTAHYTDGTSSDVTASVSWTAPSGTLSAGLGQALTASYTLGGVTKTATHNVIDVYAVTLLKKDETGATISGELSDAPAVSLTSVNHLTAAETGAKYTFKEWQVTGGSLSSTSSLTPTIDAVSGAITVTAVYYKPITVTWHVPSGVFSGPSDYSRGWETQFPDPSPDPEDYGCDGKIFYGWTRSSSYDDDDTPPALVSSGEVLTGDEHFYAVFAIQEGAGTPPTWTVTSFGSVTAGTYLIALSNKKVFNGEISSGHGQVTNAAFSHALSGSFSEAAPVGACELTLSANSSGWNMYNADLGYLYCTGSSSGHLAWNVSAQDYWFSNSSSWRYHGAKNGSGVYVALSDYTTSVRTYTSPTNIVLLKKTAAGSPATYSEYSTSCTCKGFSFHTGSGTDDAVKTTNTRTCFEQVDASTTWKIDDYVIPSDAKFFVGWQDEFKSSGLGSSSRSAVTQFNADEALYFEYTKNYGDGYRPSVGNAVGAIGTLRIWSDNSWNNCHVGFDPNGYIFKLGSTYYTMSNSATLDGARYKETEVITLTSSDISGQFQVNIAAVAPNASTGVASRYTESKNLTTMGVKSGASTWRGEGIKASDANTKGFFRIDKGEGGATNWNAHWVPCYELTFDLKGGTGTIVTTPEYVSVEAASKVVTIPTTAPTKDGYRFMGWSDADDNTVEYAAGSTHNVTLSGNKTVYAVWKQEFTVTYNYAGGSADPACAGGTFVAGETVTVCTTTPTKTASTFNGWSYSPSVTVTAGQFTMPESNVVVTASWIDTDYTLTHNGTNYTNTENKTSIKSGDTPFDLHYTCTGTYAFPNSISITGGGKSWTMGTDYTWVVAGDKQSATLHINESIISANVTIEITMQTRCTITYTIPTGGGSCAAEPTTAVLSGETVTLPNVTGINSSYSCETFLGWTTDVPDGEGMWASGPTIKAAGATSDAITGNTTFYAVYSRAGAGASGTVNLTGANIGTWYTGHTELQSSGNIAYGKERSISVGGYTWTTNGYQQGPQTSDYYLNLRDRSNSGGISWIQIPTMPGNINSITFSVTNGGSASTTNVLYFQTGKTSGESVKATSENTDSKSRTLTLTGSYTSGYITANGTIRIRSISVSYGPAPIVSHSLYCGCEVAEFDLTYDANTANYPGSTITPCTGVTGYKWTEHDDKYTICSSTPTCDGYKFIGWNTQANGSGEGGYLYQPDEEVSCWGEASVTLYAQYERVYTVTFNNQGVTTPVTQASEGATIAVPSATSPCSAEWAFVGWSETAIAPMSMLPTLVITAGTNTYTPDDDITLYAIYRKTSESSPFVAGMSGAYKISNGSTVYAGACNNSKLPETNAAGAYVFYIKYISADGGKYTIQQADGKYLKYAGSSTSLALDEETPYYWTMAQNGSLWRVQSETSGRYLQHDEGIGFKAYTGSDTDLAFVAAEGQYYYRTMSCEDDFDIIFHNNGTTINWAGGYPEANYKDLADATVVSTFPTATFDGWTFIGWRAADYTESTTEPENSSIYGGKDGTSGNTLTIASANVDLYPVFTRFEDNKPFDQINGGDYYIYYLTNLDDHSPAWGDGAKKRNYAAEFGIGTSTSAFNSTMICENAHTFTFEPLANGKWLINVGESGGNKYYLGAVSGNPDLKADYTETQAKGSKANLCEWTLTQNLNGSWVMVAIEGYHIRAMDVSAGGDPHASSFKNYSNDGSSSVFHDVYLGSCTNRVFTTNPSTTPNVEIHGQAKVTSTAGKNIKATSVLTVSASNIATANLTVTSDNSAFKFCLTSNGTYTASVNIPVVSNKVGITPIYIEYTPTATTDGIENATVTVSDGAAPTPTTATTSAGDVQGRHVPANFVIAAKWGDKWYALPANCTENTSSTTGVLIEVDNASNPTTATYAPSYTKWGLQTVRPSRKAEYGTRLVFTEQVTTATAEDQKTLYNGSTTNIQANAMYKNYMGDATDKYEWIPTTTDLKDYILTSATTLGGDANPRTVSLSNKGVFGTLLNNKTYDGKVRLLPATFVEPAEIQVIEWKASSVVVMYTGSGTKAITQLGDDDPSSAQSLSSAKIDHGVFELTTGMLTSAKNEPLNITIQNGSDAIVGRKSLVVPAIVSGSKEAPLGLETDETKLTDVVILDGATLSAVATKYTFKNITVYPGGKLVIGSGKQLGMNSLTLRGGSSWGAATYEHKYPQFVLNNTTSGAYTNSAGVINYDYVTTKDQYYSFVLPYNGSTSAIKYPVDIYGSAVNASNTGSFEFQYYDGAARAEGGTGWAVLAEPATLVAGTGYTFLGMPKKVDAYDGSDSEHANTRQRYGIHRIPMSVAAGTVQSGENNNKTAPLSVTLADKNNNSGWNLVGNPFMSTLTGMSSTDIQVGNLIHSDTDPWDGKWRWNPESSQRFVVIPDDNGQDYKSYQATTAVLPAFKNFFVQISNSGATTISFAASGRNDKNLIRALLTNEQEKDIELAVDLVSATKSDKVDLLINDTYSAEFDQDADFTKMMNGSKLNIYGVYPDDYLSFIAVDKTTAANSIAIGYQVPAGGDYTLQLSDREYVMVDAVEALYVTDHEVSPEVTTDLLDGPYNFHVNNAEMNDTRFTMSIQLAPKVITDIDIVPDEGMKDSKPLKFLYHDKMYILRNGVIYDATGKQVKGGLQ